MTRLLTDEQFKKLKENGKQENRGQDHTPVVKVFFPGTRMKWLLTQILNNDHDIAYGLCDLGFGAPELGSVSIQDLESYRTLECIKAVQDQMFRPKYPLSTYASAARFNGEIIEDECILAQHASKRVLALTA